MLLPFTLVYLADIRRARNRKYRLEPVMETPDFHIADIDDAVHVASLNNGSYLIHDDNGLKCSVPVFQHRVEELNSSCSNISFSSFCQKFRSASINIDIQNVDSLFSKVYYPFYRHIDKDGLNQDSIPDIMEGDNISSSNRDYVISQYMEFCSHLSSLDGTIFYDMSKPRFQNSVLHSLSHNAIPIIHRPDLLLDMPATSLSYGFRKALVPLKISDLKQPEFVVFMRDMKTLCDMWEPYNTLRDVGDIIDITRQILQPYHEVNTSSHDESVSETFFEELVDKSHFIYENDKSHFICESRAESLLKGVKDIIKTIDTVENIHNLTFKQELSL